MRCPRRRRDRQRRQRGRPRSKLTTISLGNPGNWSQFGARLHALIEGGDDHTPLVERPRLVAGVTT